MHRFPAVPQAAFVLLSIFAISLPIHASTPRHVFYLASGSSITTYNVDPTTGVPTQVGTILTISGAQFTEIFPSPNDHFIYVLWPDAKSNFWLSVYHTDTFGVPRNTPVQKLAAQGWQFMIHPDGKYAYILQTVSGQQGYSSTLYLYHVDPTTAALTQDPTIQATYGPDYYYMESLVSFNKPGTRLYDLWSVSFDGENNYYYSYHPVDTTTGQLSPDVGTIFTASNYTGLDEQYFTSNLILNLDNQNSGGSVLNVFRNVKNPPHPYFVCDQAMLNACSTAYNFWVSIDGQYVFLPDSSDIVIGHIDITNKKITETDTIPRNPFLYLSQDNQLIYAVNGSANVMQVYLFDAANGTVTAGGSTTFGSTNGYDLFTAVRR